MSAVAIKYRQRTEHLQMYAGTSGKARVSHTAEGGWRYEIACLKCTDRWWREDKSRGEVIAAWLMHEADHGAEMRRHLALTAQGEVTRRDGEQNLRGISHLIALALTVMEIDVVRRTTIRALLPEGARKPGQSFNGITIAYQRAIRRFETAGWITRIGTDLIGVNDPESLFGWVVNSQDVTPERAMTMLRIGVAAKAAAEETAPVNETEHMAEVRRQELLALTRLMQRAPGSVTNTRGRVRVVPKSSAL